MSELGTRSDWRSPCFATLCWSQALSDLFFSHPVGALSTSLIKSRCGRCPPLNEKAVTLCAEYKVDNARPCSRGVGHQDFLRHVGAASQHDACLQSAKPPYGHHHRVSFKRPAIPHVLFCRPLALQNHPRFITSSFATQSFLLPGLASPSLAIVLHRSLRRPGPYTVWTTCRSSQRSTSLPLSLPFSSIRS